MAQIHLETPLRHCVSLTYPAEWSLSQSRRKFDPVEVCCKCHIQERLPVGRRQSTGQFLCYIKLEVLRRTEVKKRTAINEAKAEEADFYSIVL